MIQNEQRYAEKCAEVKALLEEVQHWKRRAQLHEDMAAAMSNDCYFKTFCRAFVTHHPGYMMEPDGQGHWEKVPLTPKQLWSLAREMWDAKPEDC